MNTAQPLSDEAVNFIKEAIQAGSKPYFDLTLENARKQSYRISQICGGKHDFLGKRKELFTVSSNWPDPGIPVYVYTPNSLPSNPVILVFFHGGGMVVGSRDNYHIPCQTIAEGAQCIVVNAEYRLAPEHKFPAMMDDARDVVKWVQCNKVLIGGSDKSKVGVAGDSAGGTITGHVCHEVDGLAFQVLIYPRVMSGQELASHKEYSNGPVLTKTLVEWFESQSCGRPEDVRDPRNKCLYRDRFDHLPPTLFIVAECDMLRDESYEYKKKLEAAGVTCELLLIKGVLHAFFHLTGIYPSACKQAHDKIIEFIRKHYISSPL